MKRSGSTFTQIDQSLQRQIASNQDRPQRLWISKAYHTDFKCLGCLACPWEAIMVHWPESLYKPCLRTLWP